MTDRFPSRIKAYATQKGEWSFDPVCGTLFPLGKEHVYVSIEEFAALKAERDVMAEACKAALNYMENTESELGITLGSADGLRKALESSK